MLCLSKESLNIYIKVYKSEEEKGRKEGKVCPDHIFFFMATIIKLNGENDWSILFYKLSLQCFFLKITIM
jgi:hypothetical protein